MNLVQELKVRVAGEVKVDDETLKKFSRDASLLEVKPQVVLAPAGVEDIKKTVRFVSESKKENPNLAITARAAGTCMSGGPLSESIVLDFLPHFQGVKSFDLAKKEVTVLAGTYYRDMEKETLKRGLILPCYTASKEINAVGGMVGNNSAGEKTLRYGKTDSYVTQLKVVFADGNEYIIKPLSKPELEAKMTQNDFEGELYKKLYSLLTTNRELLVKATPSVSKNSAGYALWNVWDPSSSLGTGGTFDLTKLIVGSQGTLGIVTEITFRLVPVKPVSKLLVIFLKELKPLAQIVNVLLAYHPESLEAYDDNTTRLEMKFFPDLMRAMKMGFVSLAWSFLPEFGMILRGGLPKMVILAEVAGDNTEDVDQKLVEMQKALEKFKVDSRITRDENDTKKYWTIRRESFNILRKHVHGRRTAPFIDDVIVKPEYLPEFLPKLTELVKSYGIFTTIQGHVGNGNFHVIPLMDMNNEKNRAIIPELSEKVYDLVLSYGGSITAEHNDGLIRTAYLEKMYGKEVVELFRQTKQIFDPQNIFNPGKKVPLGPSGPGTLEYMENHLARN